jgi:bifunctional non-homologous end joining protein LigD
MLWRVRSQRLQPAGFILPCQPLLVDKPPAGLGWLHEVKHDGWRIIARKDGARVTLWSRYGTNLTHRMPKIAEAICSLAVKNAVIDGEAVALRPDGHSDFAALLTKTGSARAPPSPNAGVPSARQSFKLNIIPLARFSPSG